MISKAIPIRQIDHLCALRQWKRSVEHSLKAFPHNDAILFPFRKLSGSPSDDKPVSLEADMNVFLGNIRQVKSSNY